MARQPRSNSRAAKRAIPSDSHQSPRKRTRVTGQDSSLAAEASSSGHYAMHEAVVQGGDEVPEDSSSDWVVVNADTDGSQDYYDALSQYESDIVELPASMRPIVDKDDRSFRLMDMPPEIRIEIYRACLTRPYNVLLSRNPPPPPERTEEEHESPASDEIASPSRSDDNDGNSIQPQTAANSFTPMPAIGPTRPSQSMTGFRSWAARANRPVRLLVGRSAVAGPTTGNDAAVIMRTSRSARSQPARPAPGIAKVPRASRPQDEDPLLVDLLRASHQIYKEARSVLYSENHFILDLETALPTLAALHQRSRRQIKYVELTIPSHSEILERFAEVARLSLRYCWGLKMFVINMPFTLPGSEGSGTQGNTTVYANAFDILRWLPKQCEVVLQGNVCEGIRTVVAKNATLAKNLDELAYARRQLISNETGPSIDGE